MSQGLQRINSGPLPKQHSLEELYPGRVVHINRPPRDESINDRIQREGANLGSRSLNPDKSEKAWYRTHKGYSKNIPFRDSQ